jgi:hypothetical protein
MQEIAHALLDLPVDDDYAERLIAQLPEPARNAARRLGVEADLGPWHALLLLALAYAFNAAQGQPPATG